MKPANLKEIILAGFYRFYFDSGPDWSRQDLEAGLSPRGYINRVTDPEVQQLLRELEKEGHIQLVGQDDKYLIVNPPLDLPK